MELPRLEPIYRKYKDQGLSIVAVEAYRDTESAKSFIAENELTYTFLEENEAEEEKVVKKIIGNWGFPTTFIIDREGKVVYTHQGFSDGDEIRFEEEILALL